MDVQDTTLSHDVNLLLEDYLSKIWKKEMKILETHR